VAGIHREFMGAQDVLGARAVTGTAVALTCSGDQLAFTPKCRCTPRLGRQRRMTKGLITVK